MAASRGKQETEKLKTNVEDQLNRLLSQLQDLEEGKEFLDEDEYEATKSDTLQQLREFEATLKKMMAGDVSLVDHLGGVQLAIQAAVSNAFKTPEVIKLFAKKQPRLLRSKLVQIQNPKTGAYVDPDQAIEILVALKKLGEQLSGEEEAFLEKNMNKSMADFQKVSNSTLLNQASSDSVLKVAGNQIKRAQQ
eukprot:TRINITY_DN15426_c0_g1_i1.p2 TRINITY_DN15426_c0_g1~~TRINITY_DN15426_c0_g1_i1.p2  ORF type:complete len:221 (-),score=82.90 TRINITY_DN15426_c0_g1_i1:100-675(-)